jgi:putative permease
MTKRIMVIAAGIMTALLALAALWQFRVVVIYVLISLVLAATFRPIEKDESRQNFRTRLVLVARYVFGFIFFALLLFTFGKFFVGDIQHLTEQLSTQSSWIVPPWLQGTFIQTTLLPAIPTPDKILNAITSQRQLVVSAVMGFTQSLGGVVSGSLIIFFLSIYWSINQNHFERLWLSLLPAEKRKQARYIWRTIEHDLGAYTRSELIQSLLAAVLLGVGYSILGSPYATLLAVIGAIAWLVPMVGAVLAILLPFLIGLLTSVQLSLATVLYTLVVLAALQIWVEPRLFKLKQDNPVLTFTILLIMADSYGLLGIIAAPPVSVIVQTLWNLLVAERIPSETVLRLSDIKEQRAQLQHSIQQIEGTPPPLVTSSMERLAELLEKSEPLLRDLLPPEPQQVFSPVEPINQQEKNSKSRRGNGAR